MLRVVLTLIPTLPSPAFFQSPPPQQQIKHEQIAMTSCLSAVKSNFPCHTIPAPDYACLCSQHLWRISCYENYAPGPWDHADRTVTEGHAHNTCRAAGSVVLDKVQKEHARRKRQIGDFLSSIVGDVSSILSSKGVTVPTAVIESVAGGVVNALPTPVDPTSIAVRVTATSAVGDENGSMTITNIGEFTSSSTRRAASVTSSEGLASSSSATPLPLSPSNSDSETSAGLIAGVVIGAIAALALIGIFILLLLRHRRKNKYRPSSPFTDKEASPTISSLSSNGHVPQINTSSITPNPRAPPAGTPTALVSPEPALHSPISPISPIIPQDQAPWASSPSTLAGGTLPRYYSSAGNIPLFSHYYPDSKMPQSSEMPTSANAWELDGREISPLDELGVEQKHYLDINNGVQRQGQGQAQVTNFQPGEENRLQGEFIGNKPVESA
ncbi:hypothetical protein J3E72DRAFT_385861 [Bipolaris maydis]|uniref:uncharacterized protein n=1 Tax=Cochliobolus heterostrophus TaxID=5016 RepID=UPI0024DA97EE|nr:hypothetical protein J3E73DRAFT_211995 [Bipolaris maydis]KAJ5059339.1 hypothetical protein J3E74DRAFT_418847 [Bipolaris maydis]KAJ6197686.1 hypothetical protein J3E72DRAFT_385861 [Bipolaris maydis]KAJ6271666.1 hypothetical protein PSV08DRAFT_362041 [Bipolaris maydis]KAJ6282273.1 hypothetical protein J3E71DRAFT_352322 [Bipolaris maydis]